VADIAGARERTRKAIEQLSASAALRLKRIIDTG